MAYDKEKNMTQKYYNFEKLTPDKDADISVYEEAIEFVFDNSDITNIAISGAYGAGKSSIIESYEKKHDDKNFLHISLAHFEPTERNESEDSVKETTLEGKILNQLIHQIPVDRIPQTNFRVKKDVGRRNIIIITILLYVLLGSITFISMSNKIQNWVDALCDEYHVCMVTLCGTHPLSSTNFLRISSSLAIVYVVINTLSDCCIACLTKYVVLPDPAAAIINLFTI